MSLFTLFVLVALVLFVLSAIGIPSRIGLGWLGLAFYMLALLIGGERLLR